MQEPYQEQTYRSVITTVCHIALTFIQRHNDTIPPSVETLLDFETQLINFCIAMLEVNMEYLSSSADIPLPFHSLASRWQEEPPPAKEHYIKCPGYLLPLERN